MLTRGMIIGDLITRGAELISFVIVECFVTLHVSGVELADNGYFITVTVTAAGQLPVELFVFQRQPLEAGTYKDVFCHIASLVDIEEYPVGAPNVNASFYRLAAVEFVFRSLNLLYQTLQDLKCDIHLLAESAEANLVLTEDTVEIT
jgi:hypothetical protein